MTFSLMQNLTLISGQSRRTERIWRANCIRSRFCNFSDPGCQKLNERRRPDRQGQLRGQHQVPETSRSIWTQCQTHCCLEDEGKPI